MTKQFAQIAATCRTYQGFLDELNTSPSVELKAIFTKVKNAQRKEAVKASEKACSALFGF